MNILELNEDIMSKVKHNLFLKSLMKHREDNFNYDGFDWTEWEYLEFYDTLILDKEVRGSSYPPQIGLQHDSDIKLFAVIEFYYGESEEERRDYLNTIKDTVEDTI